MDTNKPSTQADSQGQDAPQPKSAAQPVRSDDELRLLWTELLTKYPCPQKAKDRLIAEVMEPFKEKEIDRVEAEVRWKKLAEQYPPRKPPGAAGPAAGPEVRREGEPEPPSAETSSPAPAALLSGPEAPPAPQQPTAPGPTPGGEQAAEASPAASAESPPETAPGEEEAPPPVVPRKPEWKVLEPENRCDPVEHERCELLVRNDQWKIMAASVRGKLHAHKAMWRDDAYRIDWTDDWTIIAVSDGAGSAEISRVGARIACDESVKTLKGLLKGSQVSLDNGDQPSESDLIRIRTFLAEAARKAQAGIIREAQSRNRSIKDLHATLLLMVHKPLGESELVAAIQVGDGAVGIYTQDGSCTLMGTADHGEYSSETRFLTTPHIEREFDGRVLFSIKKEIRCLAAMCDGVSDDFFPEEKRLAELFVGDPISDMTTKSGGPVRGVMHEVVRDPQQGKALLQWLTYEKKASSDDRTLVLMYRSLE